MERRAASAISIGTWHEVEQVRSFRLSARYRILRVLRLYRSVQMTVSTYPERRTIRNVIGYIKGSVEPGTVTFMAQISSGRR